MVTLNPKQHILDDKELAQFFRSTANSQQFQKLVIHSLAVFAASNPSAEQLNGANRYLSTLLNIAEPEVPAGVFPDKATSIHSSFSPKPATK